MLLDRHALTYRLLPPLISLILMGLMAMLYLSEDPLVKSLRERLQWISYDLRMNLSLQENKVKPSELPITIVDIDEASLNKLGHWPWSRDHLSKLVDNLSQQGAVIITFDVLFAERQNQAQALIQQYQQQLSSKEQQAQREFFQRLQGALNTDSRFADTVASNEVVLSVVFNRSGFSKGQLSHPLDYETNKPSFIQSLPAMQGYVANLPELQQAANYMGFINAYPDDDGVLRRVRLIQKFDGEIYPSLALASSIAFLLPDKIALHAEHIGDIPLLQAIKLGQQRIPVDGNGDILIPFIGPAHSFSYVSALDVLNKKNDASLIEGRIILIGSTAAALSDFRATPTNNLYPGVEAHANVINGIISNQFYAKPEWSHGINFMLIIVGGILLALVLPLISPPLQLLLVVSLAAAIFAFDAWLWIEKRFVIDSVVPLLNLLVIGAFNIAYGFVINSRDRLQLKAMFGQYVPPQLVDYMSKNPGDFAMEGDRREMSVLFSDIRSFTSISESLSAGELKDWLNAYFTPITEVIFKHQGTIDKYVGDMVMAFWGAPINDKDHAYHAVQSALKMLEKTQQLKQQFIQQGKPPVDVGIGISSGMMNVGNMGSKYRRSYTVLGDMVNLGSRLEGLTKFYGVKLIISERTRELIGERFIYRHLDRVRVKGKEEPVDIYEPLSEPGQLSQPMQEELAQFHQAQALYLQGNFQDAVQAFEALTQASNHRLYRLYLERCQTLMEKPPQHWDGVFIHTSK